MIEHRVGGLWYAGWYETDTPAEKFERAFSYVGDAGRWLADELAWYSADLPTSDPLGDVAMDAAKKFLDIRVATTVEVGTATYFAKMAPLPAGTKLGS